MFARLATGLLALALAGFGLAQSGQHIKIEFLSEGEREIWVGSSDATKVPASRTPVSGRATEFPIPSEQAGQSIFVHDRATGAVAVKPVSDAAKSGAWKLSPKDFTSVYSVQFIVKSGGADVESASLKLEFKGGSRVVNLTEADRGLASFYLIPPSDVHLSVAYKTKEGTGTIPTQTFGVTLGKPQAEPWRIELPGALTSEAGGDEAGSPGQEQENGPPAGSGTGTSQPTSPIVTLLNVLVGLLVVAAIAYGVYSYIKNNPKQLDGALAKVGLQTAQDDPDPGAVPAAPQPVKKIILEDADPTMATIQTPAPASAVPNPRLVRPDGGIFLILDGASQVGREPGLPVSLEGETTVSRAHAELVRTGDAVVLRDLGSTNGTFVNGAKLTGEVTLSPGDTVQFGAVSLRFEA